MAYGEILNDFSEIPQAFPANSHKINFPLDRVLCHKVFCCKQL